MTANLLNSMDLQFVCTLLHQRTGVVLDGTKDYLIDARLSALANDEGLAGPGELLAMLRSGNSGNLRERFTEALLTKETSFFRDLTPFVALQSTILPELIRRRRAERRLVVWSGACSTGQEIYSLAMTIMEHFPELRGWSLELLASDVSDNALARAKDARYSLLEVNRGLPVSMLLKYFKQREMEWQVRDDIREMVRFFQLNLIEPWPVLPPADIVLMRNVLLYMDSGARRRILEGVSRMLRPAGYLLLGSAESSLGDNLPFVPTHIDKTVVFRLRDARGEKR